MVDPAPVLSRSVLALFEQKPLKSAKKGPKASDDEDDAAFKVSSLRARPSPYGNKTADEQHALSNDPVSRPSRRRRECSVPHDRESGVPSSRHRALRLSLLRTR